MTVPNAVSRSLKGALIGLSVLLVSCMTVPPEGSLEHIHWEAEKAARKSFADCVHGYMRAVWPNQVLFPERLHPCVLCRRGHAEACLELRDMGLM